MDRTNRCGHHAAFLALTFVMGMVALPTTEAATVTLTDDNSVFDVDTGTSAGVFTWTIYGFYHLSQR